MDKESIIKEILLCIYSVRGELKAGYLESVYKRAMMIELERHGLDAEAEREIVVRYKGTPVGFFRADIIVENCVIIELKAVESITKAHEVQLVNYLTATGIDDGILINFGENFDIKRKFRIFRPKST